MFLSFSIDWRDIIDILIVTFILYRFLTIVRGKRVLSIIYGVLILNLVYIASNELGLYTLNWLLSYFLGSLFLVVVIIFQKDIRTALATMGANNIFLRFFSKSKNEHNSMIDSVVRSASKMAGQSIGALIVIEKNMQLGEFLTKGVMLNADVSSDLLQAIFYPKNPLHDGAAIIRKDKILAAACILPLSSKQGKESFGTRHRAAIGISEESDAVVVVVSEERGEVSVVYKANLEVVSNLRHLSEILKTYLELK
ncbi:diadenylate cyclase CdaA [Desulfovibrio litoralis]|uniref:Diadenylate cyclase n=1 Tax=Desulfovibrio litoralis DSM 11393 TaxID=1121455 RepID=A0A1M7TQN7_9BACT|nr:diadenylate cyclase CdaA [Desulfovibrio litoralis]SHN73010.1 TIGR00159 family protein [Desulfovibrio litoralis DSM 11393]